MNNGFSNKNYALLSNLLTVSILMLIKIDCFDFQNGNAAIQIVIPTMVSVVLQQVTPGDATIIFRTETLLGNAWFDSTAPYHQTAVGIYTQYPSNFRFSQPGNTQKNTALLYASYQVLMSLHSRYKNTWDKMMRDIGLEPQIISKSGSPQNIGINAGKAVVRNRQNDGMNQLGNHYKIFEEKKYHAIPYWDYTGYKPKNTPQDLNDPSSWQPLIVSKNNGILQSQHFVTPQLGLTTPYSFENVSMFNIDEPSNSKANNWVGYATQVRAVVDASADLNEQRKMKAQFFDHKFRSLTYSISYIQKTNNLSLLDFIHLYFTVNMAKFDSSIPIWKLKAKFDAVRPVTAIQYAYNGTNLRSWGGPGKGTVNNMPSSQWKSYLGTGDHPQYPSATASFCAALTTAARKFLKSDKLQWTVTVKSGESVKQPGYLPVKDFQIYYKTWSDFNYQCGQSRFWGGVHFPDSIIAGQSIGENVGKLAYNFVMSYINGNPLRSISNSSPNPFFQQIFPSTLTTNTSSTNINNFVKLPQLPQFPTFNFSFPSQTPAFPSNLTNFFNSSSYKTPVIQTSNQFFPFDQPDLRTQLLKILDQQNKHKTNP